MIIKTEPELIEPYLKDASNYMGKASQVFVPETVDEIKYIFNDCFNNKIEVTISGAGTGLTGGRCPNDGIIISTELLNNIKLMGDNEVFVEPGATLSHLEDFLARQNKFYPPNPTESNASLGGNIANNASGSRTFKYGATRLWVESLDVIFGDNNNARINRGEIFAKDYRFDFNLGGKHYEFYLPEIRRRNLKDASGYYIDNNMDFIDLIIGSESTLAIITGAKLKLMELPEQVLGGLIFFDDLNNLIDFVTEVRNQSKINNLTDYQIVSGISARLIEFFDENSLNLLRSYYPQLPQNSIAAIWFEQEHSIENEDAVLNSWFEMITRSTILADATWIAQNDIEHRRLAEFRHKLPLTVYEELSNKHIKLGTDTAVPDEKSGDFLKYVLNIIKQSNLKNAVWGHIGNNHLHANLFAENDNQQIKAKEVFEKIINWSIVAGGTVSAEHGIGKIKKKYFEMMYPDEIITKMKYIKSVFNPYNLIGRGNLFID